MSFFVLAAILLITLPLSILVFQAISADAGTRKLVRRNLIVGPVLKAPSSRTPNEALTGAARRLVPASYAARLDKLLVRAGRPAGMPFERLIVIKPLLGLGVFFIGLLFLFNAPGKLGVFLLLVSTALAYFTPDVLLDSRGKTRQEEIQLALPNTLDQMLIAVEAGMGFEAAMARAARTGSGPLAMELSRTLQDIQMGRTRADAYQALVERTDVRDLNTFVRAIVQADKYGIAIGKVLRTQANEMRLKRRQRAEEQAMKVPVKILFPLIFTILPVLFIVVLSPAIVGIIHLLGGGGL